MFEYENTTDGLAIPVGDRHWTEVSGEALIECVASHDNIRHEQATPPGTVVINRGPDDIERRAWHREGIARADRRWFCFCVVGETDVLPDLPTEANVPVNMIDDQVGHLFDEPGRTGRRPAEDYMRRVFRIRAGELQESRRRGSRITLEHAAEVTR